MRPFGLIYFPCLPQKGRTRSGFAEVYLPTERTYVTCRKRGCVMRCPHCGDRRTEVLKTVYRGHNSYRHRRCVHCGSRFSTQERPVRWSRVELKWPGPCPSRKGWRRGRTAALRGKCEVESCGVDFRLAGIRRHVDHIVPARLIRRLRAGNPDRRENLECICGTCHGYKLQADHRLCLGDTLGYLEIVRTHHFDLARVERALALYGL
jgi:hypothetical protein